MASICLGEEQEQDHQHSNIKPTTNASFTSPTTFLNDVIMFLKSLNPFWIHLMYLIIVSILGFLLLKFIPSNPSNGGPIGDLDTFFMSVSAVTVSSMATVEMEAFSNAQMMIITILMLVGGEVFTSMAGIQLKQLVNKTEQQSKPSKQDSPQEEVLANHVELGLITKFSSDAITICPTPMKQDSKWFLGLVLLGYLLVFHLFGYSSIMVYLTVIPSARSILSSKGIKTSTFSIFTTVSSFANCGFIPTNENMMVFKTNSGLLLLLIPLILAGNTLFQPCLRLTLWVLKKATGRAEFEHLLRNHGEMRYDHLVPVGQRCVQLVLTVMGVITVQLVLLCCMQWNSEVVFGGMNWYQKVVGAFFQSVNSRHAGESIFDLSVLSPVILVLYIAMMYLPPQASLFPVEEEDNKVKEEKERTIRRTQKSGMFSNPSCLILFFTLLICITEKRKLAEDPLNFNVLTIVFEIISAYGNVGFSTCYSCQRQLRPSGGCKDAWYGFAGRWSPQGKLILIVVMLVGRLKKFRIRPDLHHQ